MTSSDEPIASSFKDNFSYIAAFLSVLVGLAAFRVDAESHSLQIINWNFSILALTFPFIISMMLATYIGALAMQSRTMNFTLFPLTKILELTANVFALIGLVYPFLILLTYLFTLLATYVISLVPFLADAEVFSAIISSLATFISVAIATNFIAQTTKNRLIARYEKKSEELLVEYSKIIDATHAASTMDILMQYNALTNLAKSILRIKGYSVTGDNLPYVSRKLAYLNVFDQSDITKVEDIRKIRNNIAHGTQLPTDHTIKETGRIIDELAEKLRDVLIKNSDGLN